MISKKYKTHRKAKQYELAETKKRERIFKSKPRIHVLPPMPGTYLAVVSKKHVTVYVRKPTAPGAGNPAIKAQFTGCAQQTKGIKSRDERAAKISACMKAWFESLVAQNKARKLSQEVMQKVPAGE